MRKIICLILVATLLLLSGCSLLNGNEEEVPPPQNEDRPPQLDANLRETVLYLPDKDGRVLVPVRVAIPWEEGIAKATVGYMVDGFVPQSVLDLGLTPLLPAGTTVLGLSIREGVARLDLNESFLKYNPGSERLLIYGLVYTLTEFPTITEVEILVEGKKPDLPNGLSAGALGREAGLNVEVSATVDDFENTDKIILYYLLPVGDVAYYVPMTRVVNKTNDILLTTAQELLAGPATGSPLFTALPQGVTLKSIVAQGSTLTLDLSGDFAVTGGQLAVDRIRHQVALTFTEITGIMEIAVTVDGKAPEFPPGIQFPATFGRPRQWNLVGSRQ